MVPFWIRQEKAEILSFMFPMDENLFRRAAELEEEALLRIGRQIRCLPYLSEEERLKWISGGFSSLAVDPDSLVERTITSVRSATEAVRMDHATVGRLILRREEVQSIWEAIDLLSGMQQPNSLEDFLGMMADVGAWWRPWQEALDEVDREIQETLDLRKMIWEAPSLPGWKPVELLSVLAFNGDMRWWETAYMDMTARWCFDPERLSTLSEDEISELIVPLMWCHVPKEAFEALPDPLKERCLAIRRWSAGMGDSPGPAYED